MLQNKLFKHIRKVLKQLAPTISRDSDKNSRLHAGACANFVLLAYLQYKFKSCNVEIRLEWIIKVN